MAYGIIRRKAYAQQNTPWGVQIKALHGFYRNPDEPAGFHRHWAGDFDSLWDNIHGIPGQPLAAGKFQNYDFMHRHDTVSDAENATEHEWHETAVGTGTPLYIARDVVGGAAKIVTGASAGNGYYYQSEAVGARGRQARDIWFEACVQMSDIGRSAFFIGVCADIASGNLFDNRLNSIGFYKADAASAIVFEVVLGGVQSILTDHSFVAATDAWIGFRYYSGGGRLIYYIGGANSGTIEVNPPDVLMPLSVGYRNNDGAAKTLSLKKIVFGLETIR